MVSRVYTPIITPYNRAQAASQHRGAVSGPLDENRPKARPEENLFQPQRQQADSGDQQRSSGGLQAVQMDPLRKIPLEAVLHDFHSTMQALGTDDKTRAEVEAYLQVVNLQGGKAQPEVGFIKHTLRTAAGTLDQYITEALGQPSQVVKEWVDALLMQDIDYRSKASDTANPPASPPTVGKSQNEVPPLNTAMEKAPEARQAIALDSAQKTRMRSLIESAKSSQQAGQNQQAQTQLDEALGLLSAQGQPEWEGKVWHLKGRFHDKNGAWQQAVGAFDQAAGKFSEAGRPDKQAQALQATASIWEEHGRLEQAEQAYRQVVALDQQTAARTGDRGLLTRSLNDLGSVHLRRGDTAQAVSILEQAAKELRQNPDNPALSSDVFSNLGAAYRGQRQFNQASLAYRQAMQDAKTSRDRGRYASSLQQLAAVYAEAEQPEQAMKALQRLDTLKQA